MAAPVLQFGSGVIKIGATASPTSAFECQISTFTVTPTANSINVPATYCTGPTIAAQKSTFAVALTYMSDWGQTDSLSELLWDNDGDLLFFEFTPSDNSIPECAGQFYAVAGTFGGDGDSLWTTTSSLPCFEKPVLTPQA